MDTELVQKVPNKFICVLCDYNTSRFSQYNRHLNTSKHINSTIFNSSEPLVQKKKVNINVTTVVRNIKNVRDYGNIIKYVIV